MLHARALRVVKNGRRILDDVSFTAQHGEVVALVGPSGAGKSTTLAALAGLQPLRAGDVTLCGARLSEMAPQTVAKMRAYLAQTPPAIDDLTAAQVVALGRLPHQAPGSHGHDAAVVSAALAWLQAAHLGPRLYRDLSCGEQQQVHMARLLTQLWQEQPKQPRYALLDDPVARGDMVHSHRILSVATQLAQAGAAVVVALTDVNLAMQYACRVVCLRAGQVVAEGTPTSVLTSAFVARLYGVDTLRLPHPELAQPLLVPVSPR